MPFSEPERVEKECAWEETYQVSKIVDSKRDCNRQFEIQIWVSEKTFALEIPFGRIEITFEIVGTISGRVKKEKWRKSVHNIQRTALAP